MNIVEAFETLELKTTATKSEIKEKHRELIKNYHSDKENGDHEKSTLINNAREIAIKYIDEKVNITLIKQVVDIVNIESNQNLKRTEYKEQSNSIHTKISRRFGSKYKSYKSFAKTMGLISAVIALLSSKLLPIFPEVAKDPKLALPFTILAVTSGLLYLIINSTAERIQDSIDDLKDTLSDKASYFEILNEILQFGQIDSKNISKYELEEQCAEWFHRDLPRYDNRNTLDNAFHQMFNLNNNSFKNTVKRIGVNDFIKFLISKGLEKNIIIEKENYGFGMIEIKYEINQKAST